MKNKPLKTINLEPNWQAMFDVAMNIVKTEIRKEKGMGIVVEMLDYGKRLDHRHRVLTEKAES